MFANAEHGAPETFRNTKLVSLSNTICISVTKYRIGHFTNGILFYDNGTLNTETQNSKQTIAEGRTEPN
jgi:hypothetical protein